MKSARSIISHWGSKTLITTNESKMMLSAFQDHYHYTLDSISDASYIRNCIHANANVNLVIKTLWYYVLKTVVIYFFFSQYHFTNAFMTDKVCMCVCVCMYVHTRTVCLVQQELSNFINWSCSIDMKDRHGSFGRLVISW